MTSPDAHVAAERGDSGAVLNELIRATGATAVYWNRRYEPAVIARDRILKTDLLAAEVDAKSFNASLLFEPHTVRNKSGGPTRGRLRVKKIGMGSGVHRARYAKALKKGKRGAQLSGYSAPV